MVSHPASEATPRPLVAPYDGQSASYQQWRDARLQLLTSHRSASAEFLPLTIDLTTAADELAVADLCQQIKAIGFGLYRWETNFPSSSEAYDGQFDSETGFSASRQRDAVLTLAGRLGLHHSDAGIITGTDDLSLLEDLSGSPQGRFVPYSNKLMNWHTDGYYNHTDDSVRCFTLHCLQAAESGGALTLLDPELLLIALYNEDPELVRVLASPNAMLIPGNVDAEGHNRPDRRVPVFFTHADGSLGMRFTMRTRNIQWQSVDTAAAARTVVDTIKRCSEWHSSVRLQPGQGIVARNILHQRDAFADTTHGPRRQILRGRYLQTPTLPGVTGCVEQADVARQ